MRRILVEILSKLYLNNAVIATSRYCIEDVKLQGKQMTCQTHFADTLSFNILQFSCIILIEKCNHC